MILWGYGWELKVDLLKGLMSRLFLLGSSLVNRVIQILCLSSRHSTPLVPPVSLIQKVQSQPLFLWYVSFPRFGDFYTLHQGNSGNYLWFGRHIYRIALRFLISSRDSTSKYIFTFSVSRVYSLPSPPVKKSITYDRTLKGFEFLLKFYLFD